MTRYYLVAYSKDSEEVIDEFHLPKLDINRTRQVLGIAEDEDIYAAYRIEPRQMRFFEDLVGRKFDSRKFLYYLEPSSD